MIQETRRKDIIMSSIRQIIVLIVMIASAGIANLSYAQTSALSPVEAVVTFPIKVQFVKEPVDEKGTDTTNIYTIQIYYADRKGVPAQPYTIIYFLDGRFEVDFKNQTLPFSFKRDFKGQSPGRHVIRIEIEDVSENNLASATLEMDARSPRREKTNKTELSTDK